MKSEKKESIFDGILVECKNHKSLRVPDWIEQTKGEIIDASLSKFFIAFNIKGEKYFIFNEKLFISWAKKIKQKP